MIYTWAADITPLLREDCYRQYYMKAPRFRREKADCLKRVQGKAQSIGVWALYAEMKEYFNLDGHEAYNFSHSGDYALCSVCVADRGNADVFRTMVGCDVEQVKESRIQLAKKFFCESEYQCIVQGKEDKWQETFIRYWVLKESFIKATGKGLVMPLNAFEIRLGNPPELVRQPDEFPETFYYMESELGEGTYRVAVCSTDREIDADVRVIQLGM